MRAERVVVDTNVLISALPQPSGRTAAVLEATRTVDGVLLFSDETFAELASRLSRPKFDRYVAPATRERFGAGAPAGVAAGRSEPRRAAGSFRPARRHHPQSA
jgi:predicted nucleic acid-binding protein